MKNIMWQTAYFPFISYCVLRYFLLALRIVRFKKTFNAQFNHNLTSEAKSMIFWICFVLNFINTYVLFL